MVVAMREMVDELLRSNAAREVRPFKFVSTFRQAFPLFAQRTDNGQGFVQQDAEECWSTLLTALSQRMVLALGDGSSNMAAGQDSNPPLLPRMQALTRTLGDMLFGLEMEVSYACLEGEGAEPPYTQRESVRKIECHISEKTAHLYTALQVLELRGLAALRVPRPLLPVALLPVALLPVALLPIAPLLTVPCATTGRSQVNLDEVMEKQSTALGRDAQFSKKSKIARLPPVLAVQFVRFAWRKDTAKRAKILRTVSFPFMLDVRNLCTDDLQAAIAAHCTGLEEERDAKAGGGASAAPAASAPAAEAGSSSEAAPMDVSADGETAKKTPEELLKLAEPSLGAESGDNRTGRYELFAVITHQGRTAEGGHYVGWVKKDKKKWLVFDDETVAEIDAERVKELYGGGDWHMAYMCLYRKMDGLTLDEEPDPHKFVPKEIETKGFSMEGADKKAKN
jgi:ubiquitin carboxyl-terminal hydrolase 14